MIKDVKIVSKIEEKTPEKGWYAELEWMYGDCDGESKTTVGPFPEQNKKLFIEFLNALQTMIDECKNGELSPYDYDMLPCVQKFFSGEINPEFDKLTEEEKDVVAELFPTIERMPDGSCDYAELIKFSAFWHDGECESRYQVELEMQEGENDVKTI